MKPTVVIERDDEEPREVPRGEFDCPECGEPTLDMEFTKLDAEYVGGYLFAAGGVMLEDWTAHCGCPLKESDVLPIAEEAAGEPRERYYPAYW
jgi:hypothetical protein